MKKVLLFVAGLVSAVALLAGNSMAATYDFGQLGSGDIYRVRNVSDNQTDFVKTANADPCETVQFKVRVHNAGPKTLTNVKVKATLSNGVSTSHSSTVTVSADNNRDNAVATGSAGVTVSKASDIDYVNGSTELLDDSGNRIQTLGDTILTSGVNIGSVGVSLNQMRFVQFKARLDCPTPEVKKIQVCELDTKKIITIKETDFDASKHSKNLADCAEEGELTVCELDTGKVVTIKEGDFDSTKHSKDLADCEETPVTPVEELPHTGPEAGLLAALLVSGVVAGAVYFVQSRRNVLG